MANELLTPNRGIIFLTDKNGDSLPVAARKRFPLVYAVPKVVENPAEAASLLSSIIGKAADKIFQKLSKEGDGYEELLRRADKDVAAEVEALKMKGLYTVDVPERFYPFGGLAAHILGYVGPDSKTGKEKGYYGLEEFYNDRLSGTAGEISGSKIVEPVDGGDIFLTVDPNIQKESERIITDLVQKFGAPSGSVVVEEPRTGKILAMASVPSFDPNRYSEYNIKTFLNPSTQEVYEPGSVLKIITMAAGIDAGAITPDTTFNDTGSVVLNGKKIMNWDQKAHGVISMWTVIEKSLNTGAVFAERKMGNATFLAYMKKFGFGEKTGIDIPGEVKGNINNISISTAKDVEFATASFGQGVSMTQIQLTNAFAAIANGGTLMRPYINAELGPQEIRRVVSEEATEKVTAMMANALEKLGDAGRVEGYRLAGKTGTAQVPDLINGGYLPKVNDTYIGFGPVADPRFVILIKLTEPPTNPLAGVSVVPAFRDLSQFILNYYNVPPDRINQ